MFELAHGGIGLMRAATAEAEAEHDLVARAKAGDVNAFEQIYRSHVGRVYAVCLRMTGSRTNAEDCVQEAFARAWQKLSGFRGSSALGTWLYRIAVNEVLARQRAERRREARLPRDDTRDGGAEAAPDERPESFLDLEEAIGALPDGARNVFVLHAIDGYSHEETARMLGVAVGTCKAQLHRARKLLVERLGL